MDRGLLFRSEGRGQGSRGGWGAQPQETLHELELVRGGKTSTAVGFMSYSLLTFTLSSLPPSLIFPLLHSFVTLSRADTMSLPY